MSGAVHYLADGDDERVHSRIFDAEIEGLTDATPGELVLEVDVPWADVLRGDPVEVVEHLEYLVAKARCTLAPTTPNHERVSRGGGGAP